MRAVVNTHGLSDLPVPVGTGTVAPTIPDTKDKPGSCCQQQSKQMPFSGFPESPACHIKQGKCCMKNNKENIEKGQPHRTKLKEVLIRGQRVCLIWFLVLVESPGSFPLPDNRLPSGYEIFSADIHQHPVSIQLQGSRYCKT